MSQAAWVERHESSGLVQAGNAAIDCTGPFQPRRGGDAGYRSARRTRMRRGCRRSDRLDPLTGRGGQGQRAAQATAGAASGVPSRRAGRSAAPPRGAAVLSTAGAAQNRRRCGRAARRRARSGDRRQGAGPADSAATSSLRAWPVPSRHSRHPGRLPGPFALAVGGWPADAPADFGLVLTRPYAGAGSAESSPSSSTACSPSAASSRSSSDSRSGSGAQGGEGRSPATATRVPRRGGRARRRRPRSGPNRRSAATTGAPDVGRGAAA